MDNILYSDDEHSDDELIHQLYDAALGKESFLYGAAKEKSKSDCLEVLSYLHMGEHDKAVAKRIETKNSFHLKYKEDRKDFMEYASRVDHALKQVFLCLDFTGLWDSDSIIEYVCSENRLYDAETAATYLEKVEDYLRKRTSLTFVTQYIKTNNQYKKYKYIREYLSAYLVHIIKKMPLQTISQNIDVENMILAAKDLYPSKKTLISNPRKFAITTLKEGIPSFGNIIMTQIDSHIDTVKGIHERIVQKLRFIFGNDINDPELDKSYSMAMGRYLRIVMHLLTSQERAQRILQDICESYLAHRVEAMYKNNYVKQLEKALKKEEDAEILLQKKHAREHQKEKSTCCSTPCQNPEKKPLPEFVSNFIELLTQDISGTLAQGCRKYLTRMRQKKQAIKPHYLTSTYGLSSDMVMYFSDIAESKGFYITGDTTTDGQTNNITGSTTTLDSELMAEKNSSSYHDDSLSRVIPQNAEEVLALFDKHAYFIPNRKKFIKQIQEILIEGDSRGEMRKRLCSLLPEGKQARNYKKGKYRTLNVAHNHRLVAQKADDGNYHVIGLMHHDEYSTLMPDFIAGTRGY